MTKKYARILNSTIGQEMNQLAEKLQFHLNWWMISQPLNWQQLFLLLQDKDLYRNYRWF
jgi:hypothetical protein